MSALPPSDLAQCASEPIRVPGAIQPHGRMAVLAAADCRLLAYSANWPSEAAAREAVTLLPLDAARLKAEAGPAWLGVVPLDDDRWDVARATG